jgi:ATP-dependent RNA helicase DeaD
MTDEPVTRFDQLGLATPVLAAVTDVGYEAPSPIQAASIPPLLAGRDLLGQAQTGTGKTAAFSLPLLSRLDTSRRHPQLLVLTPTRELAIQVAEAMQTYARRMKDFHILPVYGGQGMATQLRQLQRGVHVIVGTPGRIQDHLRRKTLKLDDLLAVVLDEADEMLRMGFIDDVEQILSHTPETRQVALFSATMPAPIRKIADRYLKDPVTIHIREKTATVTTVSQHYWQVTGTHKLDALTRILEASEFDGMIVFVRTRNETVELAEKLEARGFASAPLNGDMNQAVREKTVGQLKRGKLDILVATDVAARGLDVERISHVVNYDIPYDAEAYIHRIGRTGRAGRTGTAILFVAPRERRLLHAIEKATRQPITPMHLPTREDIADKRIARFRQLITDTLGNEELELIRDIVTDYQQQNDVEWQDLAAALALLVQRDRPLHPPEEKRSARAPRDRQPREKVAPGEKPIREHREPSRERRTATAGKRAGPGMETYRIEVGRDHGVEPKHIVGAITGEAGVEGQYIGHIKLFDDHSLVDLPEGMPRDIYQHLRKVRVCGHPLQISLAENDETGGNRPPPRRRAEKSAEVEHKKAKKPHSKKRKRDQVNKGKRRPSAKAVPSTRKGKS